MTRLTLLCEDGRRVRVTIPTGDEPTRPTSGPEAAIADSLDDIRAALQLLCRAEDRLVRFLRIPVSAQILSGLGQARAATASVVYQLEHTETDR